MPDEPIDSAETASEAELTQYDKAYRETRRTIDEVIETLAIMAELEDSSIVVEQLVLKREELESQRADLVRANIAFHTGRATMHPPSASLIREILTLSKKAVELTVQRATAAAVVRLATSALNKFAEIQDIKQG